MLYELSYRQPLVRSLQEEFALSLGFTVQGNSQSFVFGSSRLRSPGTSRNRVLSFGQDYISRDNRGAWALQSQFSFGLDILDAIVNRTSNGSFFSWLGQVQRAQQLDNNNLLILQADVQLTPDNIPAFYQFFIGGGQSVRGYRQNARFGDYGYRLSVEDRIPIVRDRVSIPTLQVAPFVDVGQVYNNNPSNRTNSRISQAFLAGAGLGLIWQPTPPLYIRLDYGAHLVNLRDRGNSLQDNGLYFSVVYNP